jgi:hypothetical protein
MARTILSTLVSHRFRVSAVVRPAFRALFSSSPTMNEMQPKNDAKPHSDPVLTRRDWPQNWALEELARLQTMWREGKTVAEMHASGFQNRSLATFRNLLRMVFSPNTGNETRMSLNQSRITEHAKQEMLTLHKQGETVPAISRQLGRSTSSIYRIFRNLDIRPNPSKMRLSRRAYTADELSILHSWKDREVFACDIDDKFPDRTAGSVLKRLHIERRKFGTTEEPRRLWSPAEDSQLLALVAVQPSILNTAQVCRNVAPNIGRGVDSTIARLHHLRRAEQKKSSKGQDTFTSKEDSRL